MVEHQIEIEAAQFAINQLIQVRQTMLRCSNEKLKVFWTVAQLQGLVLQAKE